MKNHPLYPILFIFLLALFFGTAVTSVEILTREKVAAGKIATLRMKVLDAFGVESPKDTYDLAALWEERVRERSIGTDTFYRLLEVDGRTAALGLPFTAPGFWGPVRGIIALTPDGKTIKGLSFVSHQETPGLGGRISEEWFTEQFRGKKLTPEGEGRFLSFVYRKAISDNEIEAITGATQTSSRLGDFLNRYFAELSAHPAFTGVEETR